MPIPSSPLARPEEVTAAFLDAWHRRDGRAIAALFAEDGDFVNVTGLWWHGRDAIAKPHEYALNSFFKDSTLKFGRTEVRRIGADAAVVRCRVTLTGQIAPDGSTAGNRQTLLTFVLQREEQGWLVASAQNTDVVPGKETHLNTGHLKPVDYRPD